MPNATAGNLTTHTFYAGDELRFTTKFTDNSGKIKSTVTSPSTNLFYSTWGSAPANNIAQVTEATDSSRCNCYK